MIQNDSTNEQDDWDFIINANKNNITLNLKELFRYKDLLFLFVKKDIITVYKQTILGPVWFVVQPILTTLIYIVVFTNVANIGTDGVPPILFYLGSVTLWNYFSDTLNITSKTFTDNVNVFGKVYFPRIIVPISKIISSLTKFLIQFGLFLIFFVYYIIKGNQISPNFYILFFPLLIVQMAILSLGIGLMVTSMTIKYRDLNFLISFAVQLLMYATPVIYPISKLKTHQNLLWLNPLSSIFETFKLGFLGKGIFNIYWMLYSISISIIIFFIGLFLFNKVEKRFVDTV